MDAPSAPTSPPRSASAVPPPQRPPEWWRPPPPSPPPRRAQWFRLLYRAPRRYLPRSRAAPARRLPIGRSPASVPPPPPADWSTLPRDGPAAFPIWRSRFTYPRRPRPVLRARPPRLAIGRQSAGAAGRWSDVPLSQWGFDGYGRLGAPRHCSAAPGPALPPPARSGPSPGRLARPWLLPAACQGRKVLRGPWAFLRGLCGPALHQACAAAPHSGSQRRCGRCWLCCDGKREACTWKAGTISEAGKGVPLVLSASPNAPHPGFWTQSPSAAHLLQVRKLLTFVGPLCRPSHMCVAGLRPQAGSSGDSQACLGLGLGSGHPGSAGSGSLRPWGEHWLPAPSSQEEEEEEDGIVCERPFQLLNSSRAPLEPASPGGALASGLGILWGCG
ncbi:proline-rich protein 36-like [Falco cherrug]|uniref:proline-rich protein 36-like n=1 Tax=Falco cherrug TaxID=345164 RepID=UPI002479A0EC|nr:proline-rich protein 36-like [Falco cherrug]